MSERDLEARLDAVERALTDGETDLAELEETVDLAAELDRLEERMETVESTVADLEAAVQAVRGYAGNLRAVNRDVERRASAALAKAETLETALEDGRDSVDDVTAEETDRPGRSPHVGNTTGHPARADEADRTSEGSAPDAGSDPDRSGHTRAGDEAPTDRPDDGNARPGRTASKYGGDRRSSDADAGNGPDARSDRGYAVGDLGGRSAEGHERDPSRRTAQFIERVRDVL